MGGVEPGTSVGPSDDWPVNGEAYGKDEGDKLRISPKGGDGHGPEEHHGSEGRDERIGDGTLIAKEIVAEESGVEDSKREQHAAEDECVEDPCHSVVDVEAGNAEHAPPCGSGEGDGKAAAQAVVMGFAFGAKGLLELGGCNHSLPLYRTLLSRKGWTGSEIEYFA